eukprot:TRINITY_DN114_c0_g2_i1.p1 TRINITY_DN114_c0_g2~~TRINITY_DN114_c0_g2_i1.p1  ORF type:complete len:433 (-),score=47.89 TRINITY_DN114_c0_g2_i1:50-1348(-)
MISSSMILRSAMALLLGPAFGQTLSSCGSEGSCLRSEACDEVPEPQHTVLLQYEHSLLEACVDISGTYTFSGGVFPGGIDEFTQSGCEGSISLRGWKYTVAGNVLTLTTGAKATISGTSGSYTIDWSSSDGYPTYVQLPCTNIIPSGQSRWYAKMGSSTGKDCMWYAGDKLRCSKYGGKFANFGYTASQACCVCGGGTAMTTSTLSMTSTLTTTPGTERTKTETTGCDGTSCQIWGDPHVSGFDNSGHKFPGYLALLSLESCEGVMRPIDVNMYDEGDFWLVRSAEVFIQGRFALSKDFVPDRPAVGALAISGPILENKLLVVQPLEMAVSWDGQQLSESDLDRGMTLHSLDIRSHKGGRVMDVQLPKGVHLHAVRFPHHIDASVTLPESFIGSVDGLCGNRNGVADDDAEEIVAKRMHSMTVLTHERLLPA